MLIERGIRHSLCIQAAPRGSRARVYQFGFVPRLGSPRIFLSAGPVYNQRLRALLDGESRRAADAVQSKKFSGQRRSARAAALALFSDRRGYRPRPRWRPVEGRVDRIVQLVALVFNREAWANVSGRGVGPALF